MNIFKRIRIHIIIWYWWKYKIKENEFHSSLDIFTIKDHISLARIRDLVHLLDSGHSISDIIKDRHELYFDELLKYL